MNRLCVILLLTFITSSLALAASAKDMIGTWTVDAEATWNKLKDLPQIKNLPPDVANGAKSAFLNQATGMIFTFTDKLLTTSFGGTKREETYVIISIDGDTITSEGTDAEGRKERSLIRFVDGGMELTSVSEPMQKVVLKRKGGDSAAAEGQ
jgi:hypothetical protein